MKRVDEYEENTNVLPIVFEYKTNSFYIKDVCRTAIYQIFKEYVADISVKNKGIARI